MRCPTAPELAAGGEPIITHAASCARCAAIVARDAQLAGLGATLPWRDSSAVRVEEMRAELLATAGTPARPARTRVGRPIALAMVAAAAAAIIWVVVGRGGGAPVVQLPAPEAAPRFHGTISPHDGATWLRVSGRPDEIVRLVTGAITIDVTPLSAGERFRVVTGDAEVEVRGTSFEVVADRDHLISVHVWSGHVQVTPASGASVMLAPGATWAPAARITETQVSVTAPRTEAPARPVVQPVRREHAAAPGPQKPPSDAETSYQAAWRALRDTDYASAANGFAHTATLDSPLAEDAAFWRGVALARGKRPGAAREAFTAFVDGYPRSPRRGEAQAMLGWILVEAGELVEAEARFRAAIDDRADSVRASAQHGLDAIHQR